MRLTWNWIESVKKNLKFQCIFLCSLLHKPNRSKNKYLKSMRNSHQVRVVDTHFSFVARNTSCSSIAATIRNRYLIIISDKRSNTIHYSTSRPAFTIFDSNRFYSILPFFFSSACNLWFRMHSIQPQRIWQMKWTCGKWQMWVRERVREHVHWNWVIIIQKWVDNIALHNTQVTQNTNK